MQSRYLTVVVLCALTLGCSVSPSPQHDPGPTAPAKPAAVTTPAVNLSVATWKETEAMIAGHKGKVVVVDLWSSWCEPCIAEFPGLVKLQEKHGDKVVCISFNLNYSGATGETPEDSRAEVLKFLGEQKAEFQNILCSEPDTDVYQTLHLAAVPAVLVYDKSGQLRKRFDNENDEYGKEGYKYDPHVAGLVETLLAE